MKGLKPVTLAISKKNKSFKKEFDKKKDKEKIKINFKTGPWYGWWGF